MVSNRTTLHAAAGLAALSLFALPSEVSARDRFITVASTTSTENSGLFDHILPKFDAASGIEVRVIAVGTGAAIKLAEDGNADVLFVHHRPSEMAFVADGFGVKRFDVMYNDFILVGPKSDPAGIHDGTNLALALKKIAATKAPFTSRADGSGTHKMELSLWVAADIDVKAASGTWYRETGSSMGATLNTASAMEAYTLTDRGTWIKFGNKGPLIIKVEGDPRLFNPYGVILVNPQRHPHTKAADGQRFIDWLLSKTGQKIIAEYRIDGKLAFFSNAESPRNAF
ncbi:MAG: substrate-binding domain-containing protein [Rhodospirillales bacterium]|jgi:tungstate transport system substrate-binding protein